MNKKIRQDKTRYPMRLDSFHKVIHIALRFYERFFNFFFNFNRFVVYLTPFLINSSNTLLKWVEQNKDTSGKIVVFCLLLS